MIFFENSLNSVIFVCFVCIISCNLLIEVEEINDAFSDFKNRILYDYRSQEESFKARKCFEKDRTTRCMSVTHETRNER